MSKPPDESLTQGRNRSWLLVKFACKVCLLSRFYHLSVTMTSSKKVEKPQVAHITKWPVGYNLQKFMFDFPRCY